MATIKEICDKFDAIFELEGKKQKDAVTKLKKWIEEKIDLTQSEVDKNITITQYYWLLWMYGKVQFLTEENNNNILDHYKNMVEEYDAKSKGLTEKYHVTSMYQMVQIEEW
jgi:hypothetical protein